MRRNKTDLSTYRTKFTLFYHILTHSPTCLLIHWAPSFFSPFSFSCSSLSRTISPQHTFSNMWHIHAQLTTTVLFLWAAALKKSFCCFYSLALKSTDVLVNQPKQQTHAAYSPYTRRDTKKDNVVIDFSDKFFYRLTRWPIRIPIFSLVGFNYV